MKKLSWIFFEIGKVRVVIGLIALIIMMTILIEKQNSDWKLIQFTLIVGLPIVILLYLSLVLDLIFSARSNKLNNETKKTRKLYFLSLILLLFITIVLVLI
jgi:cytochrome b561